MKSYHIYSHNTEKDTIIIVETDPAMHRTLILCYFTDTDGTDDYIHFCSESENGYIALCELFNHAEHYFNGQDDINYDSLSIPAQDGIYNALYYLTNGGKR